MEGYFDLSIAALSSNLERSRVISYMTPVYEAKTTLIAKRLKSSTRSVTFCEKDMGTSSRINPRLSANLKFNCLI